MAPKPKSRSSLSSNSLPTNSFKSSKPNLTNGKKSLTTTTTKSSSSSSSFSKNESLTSTSNASTSSINLIKSTTGFKKLYNESKNKMGRPTHGNMEEIEVILRVFDTTEDYGPCSNISRLERYERAVKIGLEVPIEIGNILRSPECSENKAYKFSPFTV